MDTLVLIVVIGLGLSHPVHTAIDDPHFALLYGGNNAGNVPWQVRLRDTTDKYKHICAGAIIAPNWILTAAHCIWPRRRCRAAPSDVQVHVGDQTGPCIMNQFHEEPGQLSDSPEHTRLIDIPPMEEHEIILPVEEIIVHEGYDNGNVTLDDIALIRTDVSITYNAWVRNIRLPESGDPPPGKECVTTGWGKTENISTCSWTLQEAHVPITDTIKCHTEYRSGVVNKTRHICAGDDEIERVPCLGDSGGPLVCPDTQGVWRLHGVTSFGFGCHDVSKPAVYTRVTAYLPWIYKHVNEKTKPVLTGHARFDDFGEVYVDGKLVATTALVTQVAIFYASPNWQTIAFHARNKYSDSIRGAILTLGSELCTNASQVWKCSSTGMDGWMNTLFDESLWDSAVPTYGLHPVFDQDMHPRAHYIWSRSFEETFCRTNVAKRYDIGYINFELFGDIWVDGIDVYHTVWRQSPSMKVDSFTAPSAWQTLAFRGVQGRVRGRVIMSLGSEAYTDATRWRCVDSRPQRGWQATLYNDSSWSSPKLVSASPNLWTKQGNPKAHYIWMNTNSRRIYCRFNRF